MTPQREEAERFLRLARRDEAAFRALLATPSVDFSVACFHAQQAVEKALKAIMFLHRLEFQRTHDLEELAGRLMDAGVVIPLENEELRRLTPYAVEFRYDDEPMPLVTPEQAVSYTSRILGWADNILANFP
ncbi:MAG: HEPN domain-containing protein [Nitrosomonadales bacterium]|nr:HEPN domain-containing protein [Nitrosomonadales bacterium]